MSSTMCPPTSSRADASAKATTTATADAPAGPKVDIQATGQPDTPIEVITDLLQKALKQSSLEGSQDLVQKALDIASGLDGYMEKMSSPPPKVRMWGERARVCELRMGMRLVPFL
jgi:hypothetical protein